MAGFQVTLYGRIWVTAEEVAPADPTVLKESGLRARSRMKSWSIRENIEATVEAVTRAITRKKQQLPK